MSFSKSALSAFATSVALAASVAACFNDVSASSSSSGGSAYEPPTDDGGSVSTQPLVVLIDPGRTLNAPAGQGVGVFVTYQPGGTWLVQWTCDTSITGETCPFQIDVYADTGTMPAQVVNDTLSPGGTLQTLSVPPGQAAIHAQPAGNTALLIEDTTTTALDFVSFVTSPGATITVDVNLNGQPSSQYFFYVQNGVVNGNYTGPLADPLEFEPKSP